MLYLAYSLLQQPIEMQTPQIKNVKTVSLKPLLIALLMLGTGCQLHNGAQLGSAAPSDPQSAPGQFLPPPASPGETQEITLSTAQNQTTQARIWGIKPNAETARFGMIFASGINGGYEQPCDLIYDRFSAELALAGVTPIFVKYRYPGVLNDSIEDVQAAATYLKSHGVKQIGLAGWSFGGAVVIQSAVLIPEVRTVTTFAAQSLDTEAVAKFTHQSLLVIHSLTDENVPFYAARQILEQAPLTIHKDAFWLETSDHLLDRASAQVDPVFRNWIHTELMRQNRP